MIVIFLDESCIITEHSLGPDPIEKLHPITTHYGGLCNTNPCGRDSQLSRDHPRRYYLSLDMVTSVDKAKKLNGITA